MRLSTPVLAAAVVGLLALPSASVAAPGSAAVDQYRENIPADAGGGDGSGSKGGSGTELPSASRKALEDAGQDGKDLARALGATSSNAGTSESDADVRGEGSTSRSDSSSDVDAGAGAGGGDSATPGATSAAAAPGASEEASTAGSAVEAGVGADLGPVPLWAALAVVLLGSVGFAVLKRARS